MIKTTVKQAVLFIEIKNSYSGKIIEKRDKLYTTQKELAIHGIGLENVKKVVADQDGDIQIVYRELLLRTCTFVFTIYERVKGE